MVSIDLETKKMIEENAAAFATVNEEGKPNVIGVAFIKVVAEDRLLITDNYMKQTKENLSKNNNVCLAVWDKEWNGIKLIGTATYHTDWEWKLYIEKMPENAEMPSKWAILVDVSELIPLW